MATLKKIGWSATVKLSHWLVALAVIVNFFNETGKPHRLIGYACVCLVLIRIFHGLSKHSPQSSHFYWPSFKRIQLHIAEIQHKKYSPVLGHNPVGQWAVYLMWALIFLLTATGWLSRTDAFWGDDWPVSWHVLASDCLMGVVVIHIFAVILMSILTKHHLIRQMLFGRE